MTSVGQEEVLPPISPLDKPSLSLAEGYLCVLLPSKIVGATTI